MLDMFSSLARTRTSMTNISQRFSKRIEEAGLTLNKEKCQFSKNLISFLGQVVDGSGINPDPNKASAIKNVGISSNVSDVRRFLGTTNQLSKFIPNLADKTKPLRDLLCKDYTSMDMGTASTGGLQ